MVAPDKKISQIYLEVKAKNRQLAVYIREKIMKLVLEENSSIPARGKSSMFDHRLSPEARNNSYDLRVTLFADMVRLYSFSVCY